MSYQILSSEYISKHRYFTARKDGYQTPSGKVVDPYFVVELPVSVCALALTAEREGVLVKQYRYPIGEELLEIPGGFVDPGEQPGQAIIRELLEETGYEFESIHYLGNTCANPGVLNNYTHMYLALDGKKVGRQSLDDNEEIEVHLVPLTKLKSMLQQNEIKQSMHALCLFYAFEFLQKMEMEGPSALLG
ncbi:MAG: NUDIX hydrolase [Ferruginibacter sp.]|nr:NUDIX hydrolase [Ferruginibacter sp.]